MKNLTIFIILAIIIFIALFIGLLAFTWRNDVSEEKEFKAFLNTPFEVKEKSSIILDSLGRFKPYNLTDYYPPEDYKTVITKKIYEPGDKIQFYAAKSYYSMHVGTTYYLLGRDTLTNGKVIEFEYFISNYSPHIWETLDEFLERKKRNSTTL